MEPGSVVWHKAGGFPFWPYVVVTPDNVTDKLQQKLKTLAMGVALRCLPLQPPLFDVAASNKLEPWTPENCEKHTATCRKDKRKMIGGQIDAALSEAELIAGTLKISAPEPVAAPSPAPAPSAGKKTMLKLKGSGAKQAVATEPEASAAAAASPAPAPSGPRLKLKVGGGGTGRGTGVGQGSTAGKAGKGSAGKEAAEGEVGATATESNAGIVGGAGVEGKAEDSSVTADHAEAGTEAGTGTGAEGTDWVAPTHRMTKVRAKLLGLKPPSAVTPAIAPGRPAAVPAPMPSGTAATGTGAPQLAPQQAATVEEQFMLVKGKKKDKAGKHKDKHRDKDVKQGKEKRSEKDDRRSSGGAAAATAIGKRKTVVDDSDDEGDEQNAASPSAPAAPAAAVQQPSFEVAENEDERVENEDAPVLVKKRKRVERQVDEDEDDEEDNEEDGGMGLAALYSSGVGGKRKKAKKAQKNRAAADGGAAEEEEGLHSAESGQAEEESPFPPGIPPPPHPLPAEADYERAHTLYNTLTGCIASGDGQGLINALTSLLSSTALPVSTDLLLKSKLVEAVKPLRKLEAGIIPAESPLASDSALQSEVRESADMVYRRFQAECRELAAWQETHKEAMRDWQARRARRKAEQARIAKMQEGKKRRAEERAAEEQARVLAQEAAQAQAQAATTQSSHAVDMDLDTAQEQDEPTKLPEAISTEEASLLASQEHASASISAMPSSTHQAAKAVVPAPPKPVQIATAASLLGLVAVRGAAADGKPGSSSTQSGGAGTPPVVSSSSTLSAAATQAFEKDLALQLPTNATRLAGVHLLTALLAQIAVNTRDSERDIVTAAGGSRMPGSVGTDSALYCVVQKIATVLDSKLAAALQNPSAANVLPQEPLAALRAVMLALDRTCESFPRPDARALTLPLPVPGSSSAAAAGGKSAWETVTATRKLLAVLSEAGSRLRAVPSAASQGMSIAGGGQAEGQGESAQQAVMLSQQERDVLAQVLPLVPSVLREAFKGQ